MVSFPEARLTLAGSAGTFSKENGAGRAGMAFGLGVAGTDGEGLAGEAAVVGWGVGCAAGLEVGGGGFTTLMGGIGYGLLAVGA